MESHESDAFRFPVQRSQSRLRYVVLGKDIIQPPDSPRLQSVAILSFFFLILLLLGGPNTAHARYAWNVFIDTIVPATGEEEKKW